MRRPGAGAAATGSGRAGRFSVSWEVSLGPTLRRSFMAAVSATETSSPVIAVPCRLPAASVSRARACSRAGDEPRSPPAQACAGTQGRAVCSTGLGDLCQATARFYS